MQNSLSPVKYSQLPPRRTDSSVVVLPAPLGPAIATTLHGARARYPGRRIWALFEPRSISSVRKEFEQGYIDAFRRADKVIIGPAFHRQRYIERYGLENMMSIPHIIEQLDHQLDRARQIESFDEIADVIAREAEEGDVVMVMSSGAFGGVHELILDRLRGVIPSREDGEASRAVER